jgi:hypothetical protein
LLHHRQVVTRAPVLHDASITDSMDVHVVNAEATPARGKYTHRWVFERAGVSAAAGHAVDHGITTDDLVFDVEPEIGKRSTPGSHDRADESTGLCAAVTKVSRSRRRRSRRRPPGSLGSTDP